MKTYKELQEDLQRSIKEGNKQNTQVLRSLLTAYKNEMVSKSKGVDGNLNEEEFVSVVKRQIKQREDSVSQYQKAGREDLAEIEKQEATLLGKYLPEMLSEEVLLAEIQHLVTQCPASGKAIIGFVMKSLKQKYGSSFDGALANRLISQVAGV